jgi:hypothetical protein
VVSLLAQGVFGLSAESPRDFAWLLLITTVITTVVWLAVTFLTPPEPLERLREFHARVHPGGPGWRAIGGPGERGLGTGLLQWGVGCLVVYLGLFGIGSIVLSRSLGASLGGAGAVVLAAVLAAWVARTAGGAVTPGQRTASRVV